MSKPNAGPSTDCEHGYRAAGGTAHCPICKTEEACEACGGEGKWLHTFDDNGSGDPVTVEVVCADCEGSGKETGQ